MRLLFVFVLLSIGAVGCRSAADTVTASSTSEADAVQAFSLVVKFNGQEGLKRAMYDYEKFQMSIVKDVSSSDAIYLVGIRCKDYEVDGIIQKLNDDPNIIWAKRSE